MQHDEEYSSDNHSQVNFDSGLSLGDLATIAFAQRRAIVFNEQLKTPLDRNWYLGLGRAEQRLRAGLARLNAIEVMS
jgi:hypothetical protein